LHTAHKPYLHVVFHVLAGLLQRVPWNKKFPEADALALDLLEKMLQFDPRKRIDVQAALKHPWLAQLHDEAAEPSAPGEPACFGSGTYNI
jgi:serine/threonine protein kinase